MTLLRMRPCCDEDSSGLEIPFDEMSEEEIIEGCFTHPEQLLDTLSFMLAKQGLKSKQLFEVTNQFYNCTTQYMKSKFIERYTPDERQTRGLTF